MEQFILTLYALSLLLLFGYNLGQLSLIVIYLRSGRKQQATIPVPNSLAWANLPKVTIQLPLYNERYVVERLIDSVAKLTYPAG